MKVYQTRYNSDMTEGRGPMVNSHTFLHYQDAANFIDNQPGCMGRKAKWSMERYGDWEIVEIDVFEGTFDKEVEARKKALAKLSAEEKKLLGLE